MLLILKLVKIMVQDFDLLSTGSQYLGNQLPITYEIGECFSNVCTLDI